MARNRLCTISSTPTAGLGTRIRVLVVGIVFVRREEQLLSPDEMPETKVPGAVAVRKTPLAIFGEMVREKALWKLLVFIALILGVRAVYTYVYLLMPKYWIRTIGADANIAIIHPTSTMKIDPATMETNADWSPYEGWELAGFARTTLSRGEVIVNDYRVVGREGRGKWLPRTTAGLAGTAHA